MSRKGWLVQPDDLCVGCRERIGAERDERYPHGTLSRYTHGCHCSRCRGAMARWRRARNAVLREQRKETKRGHAKSA